jgi:hypothetical protein
MWNIIYFLLGCERSQAENGLETVLITECVAEWQRRLGLVGEAV